MIAVEEDRIEKIVGGLNQGHEEMKSVREPDLNHEKKIVEE